MRQADSRRILWKLRDIFSSRDQAGGLIRDSEGRPYLECMCGNILSDRTDPARPFFTEDGSFWTNSTTEFLASTTEDDCQYRTRNRCNTQGYESVALVPLRSGVETIGLLQFNDTRKGMFTPEMTGFFEGIGTSIGMALARKKAQEALQQRTYDLGERVKELKCLHGASQLMAESERPLDEIVQETVNLIPPAWQYPEITCARIVFQKSKATTENFSVTRWKQSADIMVSEEKTGAVEVYYLEEKPELDEGPFLNEERDLVDSLARQLGTVVERRKIEEQLRQAQKMEAVGQLAGGVAHDFNNLLTVIGGNVQLAQRVPNVPEIVRRNLGEIQRAADRAAALTRQLLAFSRRQPLEPRVVKLNEILLNMDEMLRRVITEDVELVTATLPTRELGSVRVDPGQLEQVILNLAINARDAMPEGGKLTVETANVHLDEEYARSHPDVTPGDHVMLAVTDTGCGMTDEVKARIFEPFFTTKEADKGTGLGLSTCYGIVKQSGGNIWVYSEPGQGTTFKIYLPRVEESPGTLHRRDDADDLPRGNETILFVEDDEAVRSMALHILQEYGYTVVEAANGEEAIQMLQEGEVGTIHLLLTDVVMPKMGGKKLADRLQSIRPDAKVLFTSGYTDNAIIRNGVLEPGAMFLQKPFTESSLARKVREALDS